VAPDIPAHLLIAGPEVAAVADDPEGAEVLHDTIVAWERLPEPVRRRVHLACLPMQDVDENAAIVNALQRWSEVIVQKSLAEGFGLTVSEAMWKARPVVASRIGGIQDQVEHEKSGILLDDPTDLQAYAGAVTRLLTQRATAQEMGRAAMRRVQEHFLTDRHLKQYGELFARLVA
jgi:trehalose synthase